MSIDLKPSALPGRLTAMLPHSSSVIGIGIWAAALFDLSLHRCVPNDAIHHEWRAWLLIGSVVLFVLLVAWLQRGMGLPVSALKFGEPNRLVISGPFRLTRNPIYLTGVLPLLGVAGYSVHIAVATIAAYILVMTKWVIVPEERRLLSRFGKDYADYAARTPRWFGRVG